MVLRGVITAVLCGTAAAALGSLGAAGEARAQEVVTSFAPAFAGPGVWYENDVRPNGTASTVDLTGEGGALEFDQPLPIGAARLTTDGNPASKAEVGLPDEYGVVEDILASLELFYSYYKVDNAGNNPFAAPSIKLAFRDADCDDALSAGDCFGTLVYEPTWNQPSNPGASVLVPVEQWIDVGIDYQNGLFWWTGGFGQPNTAGGPPLRTLEEWDDLFSSDFDTASLVLVSIGIGTGNLNQIGYFDDVEISHGTYDAWYDFEPAIGPPTDKDQCKNGGWMTFNNPPFENQGRCVSFVASGGRSGPK